MRALVTGASGFVGRHLVTGLQTRGHFVRAAVRVAAVRVAADMPPAHETVAVGDVALVHDWRPALVGIDTVFHLAGRAHRLAADEAALRDFTSINVDATVRLAHAAAASGVRRLVFISSARVMGERSSGRPFSEADPPQPHDAYAISKWQAEQQLRAAAAAIDVVVVRPPLVYGPGVGANFLRLLRVAASAWPLPLLRATAERSMAYVGNLVDALVRCGEHPRAAGQTYFVADAEFLSVSALLTLLRRLQGRPAHLWPVPVSALSLLLRVAGRGADIDRLFSPFRLDIHRIADNLDWQPPHTADEGLRRTQQWFAASLVR